MNRTGVAAAHGGSFCGRTEVIPIDLPTLRHNASGQPASRGGRAGDRHAERRDRMQPMHSTSRGAARRAPPARAVSRAGADPGHRRPALLQRGHPRRRHPPHRRGGRRHPGDPVPALPVQGRPDRGLPRRGARATTATRSTPSIAAHADDPRQALTELATVLTDDDFAAMERGCPFINSFGRVHRRPPGPGPLAHAPRLGHGRARGAAASRSGTPGRRRPPQQLMMLRTGAVVSRALDDNPDLNADFLAAWTRLVDGG